MTSQLSVREVWCGRKCVRLSMFSYIFNSYIPMQYND